MSTRATKVSTAFLFVSLLALTALPSTNGRPCAEHSTHSTSHIPTPTTHIATTHTSGYTNTYQHHHTTTNGNGNGNGQGATLTKTVTATTTTTDFVTQTHSHRTSPTGTHSSWTSEPWSSSSAFSVAGAAPSAPASGSSSSSSSGSGNGQCNTGPVQCCNSVQHASSLDSQASSLLHSLDVVLDDVDSLIGLTCSPLSGLGLGLEGNWCVYLPFHGIGFTF